jgi:hypothetical protein
MRLNFYVAGPIMLPTRSAFQLDLTHLLFRDIINAADGT